MKEVFIIAEAGVNHNGNLRIAKEMIDVAKKAGADAVKFQSFIAENVISEFAPKAEYQKRATDKKESQLDMAKKLQFDIKAHKELMKLCRRRKILFLSSAFDIKSIKMLDKLGLEIFKIPSGEITNMPYLKKLGRLKKKVILSTGMSDLKEVKAAVDILIKAGTSRRKITVLHCSTDYPASIEDVNLSAMMALKKELNINVGYSDHTPGIEIAIAAAALGASIIEKHFTLNRTMKGPDHRASLEPGELKAMVDAIRNIEKAYGNGVKKPSFAELKNKIIARKSIVALKAIKKGEVYSDRNLTVKRPGSGISPMKWDRIMGRRAKKSFRKDELIYI